MMISVFSDWSFNMEEKYDVPAGCSIQSKCKMCRRFDLNIKIKIVEIDTNKCIYSPL